MGYPGLDTHGGLTSLGRLRILGLSMSMRWRSSPPPAQRAAVLPALPTGTLARRALKWSADASPPWLHAHVLRTYSWGRLLGEAAGLKPDDELLFVACALHDLGLTERYAPDPGECFAFAGARQARRLLEAEGVPAPWAARVADAVVLHLEVDVALRRGVEAKLLHDGAALDVLGLGGKSVTPEAKRAVLGAYSREGFGPLVADRLRAVAANAPESRLAFFCRRIDFAGKAARVRLPEEDAR